MISFRIKLECKLDNEWPRAVVWHCHVYFRVPFPNPQTLRKNVYFVHQAGLWCNHGKGNEGNPALEARIFAYKLGIFLQIHKTLRYFLSQYGQIDGSSVVVWCVSNNGLALFGDDSSDFMLLLLDFNKISSEKLVVRSLPISKVPNVFMIKSPCRKSSSLIFNFFLI